MIFTNALWPTATAALLLFAPFAFGRALHVTPGSSSSGHGHPIVRTLYQYPKGTWIENIAVGANGSLLLTLLSTPHLDSLDPFQPDATPYTAVHFPASTGVTGIAEISPDTFAVAVGNFSFTTGPMKGSWGIWSVDFDYESPPDVRKIVQVAEATFLDGLSSLPSPATPKDNILVADTAGGTIWYVNTTTGEHHIAINSTYTAAVQVPALGTAGVNGIHVLDDTLYFANSGQGFFAKISITADGTPADDPSMVAHTLDSSMTFDDFAIKDGYAYLVTGSGNSIERVGLDGTPQGRIIVGSLNSTELAEPTSCAFGRTPRDHHVLYVVTSGGLATPVDGDITVGAQVLAVDTERWARWS